MNYFKINAERLFSCSLALLTVSSYEALLVGHYVLFAVYKDAEQDVKLNNPSAANANFLYLLDVREGTHYQSKKKKKKKIRPCFNEVLWQPPSFCFSKSAKLTETSPVMWPSPRSPMPQLCQLLLLSQWQALTSLWKPKGQLMAPNLPFPGHSFFQECKSSTGMW